MQPHFFITADLGDLGNWIDARGRCRSYCRDNSHWLKILLSILRNQFAQFGHIHSKIRIGRHAPHIVFADANSDGAFFDRAVRLIGSVYAEARQIASAQAKFPRVRSDLFPRRRERVHG